jgi:hypothetical protein
VTTEPEQVPVKETPDETAGADAPQLDDESRTDRPDSPGSQQT